MNQRPPKPPRPPPPKQKGTVTSIASVFPAEEAQKASQRLQDTLAEQQKQVDQLHEFIADNASLINLVQRLPDELHHNIMVPFGKAAFFPGKLIHTNEFLVLLGEGYYAERTSKQTVDILKRRGKDLETQLEAVKAVMQDLKAEASFFDATAAEAAEGLVEIREDYIEEDSPVEEYAAGSTKAAVEDEEYNRIFSRMAELEREEDEAEKANKDDEEADNQDDVHHTMNQHIISEEVRSLEVLHLSDRVESQVSLGDHSEANSRDELHVQSPEHLVSKDGSLHDKGLSLSERNISDKVLKPPQLEESDHASLITKEEVSVEKSKPSVSQVSVQKSEPSASSSKAFTGTIVERTHNLEMNATNQQAVGRSTKPESRFKLLRK